MIETRRDAWTVGASVRRPLRDIRMFAAHGAAVMDRSTHVHQHLHASAFAVLEEFHEDAVERECSGVYFFLIRTDDTGAARARFHMHVSGPDFIDVACCRSRAGEMWVEAGERFMYFGPHSHPSCRGCSAVVQSRHEHVNFAKVKTAPLSTRAASAVNPHMSGRCASDPAPQEPPEL